MTLERFSSFSPHPQPSPACSGHFPTGSALPASSKGKNNQGKTNCLLCLLSASVTAQTHCSIKGLTREIKLVNICLQVCAFVNHSNTPNIPLSPFLQWKTLHPWHYWNPIPATSDGWRKVNSSALENAQAGKCSNEINLHYLTASDFRGINLFNYSNELGWIRCVPLLEYFLELLNKVIACIFSDLQKDFWGKCVVENWFKSLLKANGERNRNSKWPRPCGFRKML